MPLQGTPDSGNIDEPDRQAARAALQAAQQAQASADAAMAAAQHSLDVANMKLATVVTNTGTYSGNAGGNNFQTIITVSLDDVVGPCIVMAHGQIQSNCGMILVDVNGNPISQNVFDFNTKQGTLGVFIGTPFGISATIQPDANGHAEVSLQSNGPNFVHVTGQLDIVGFQINIEP